MIGDVMELFQVDDGGQLFISPAISDWSVVEAHNIDTIIDLDGGLGPLDRELESELDALPGDQPSSARRPVTSRPMPSATVAFCSAPNATRK